MAFVGELLTGFSFPGIVHYRRTYSFWHCGYFVLAATLINPYGIDYPMSIYNDITSGNIYIGQLHNRFILAYTSLWPYLKDMGLSFFSTGLAVWIMTLMIFSIISLSVYELIKRKSCDFTLLITSSALYWKGMETSRACYFFPVAFFFIFSIC